MQLKIGELARKTGLSVRALHHYDAIGLLSPSHRSAAGARRYDRDDLVRLHRIQALKQLGCSLADIRTLLASPNGPPHDLLQRQIVALEAQAARAQRLGRQLRQLVEMTASGNETTAAEWLDILELMNMYTKHLNDDDMRTLLAPGDNTVTQTDPRWTALVDEVGCAMRAALPNESPQAQALAWRWMRLVIQMTGNDPALANKLMAMQLNEARAQDIVGITPAMIGWIGVSFAHARTTLFSKYLNAGQTEEVRRRQLAHLAHMDRWPALVAQLREQMQAGVDPSAAAVQTLVQRWQTLFRESYCGDDAALEVRVREAFMHEPDLRLGVGVDEALLAYLQRAHIVTHHQPRGDAGPKPSALLVAIQRAAHQLLEQPRVLDDPLALTILGEQEVQALRADLGRFREPMAQGLRSSVVVRARLAEDESAAALARGVRQRVILGAGLDTSAYRDGDAPGTVFEVDLPATQEWKRARLRETGIACPAALRFVPVDFERVSLADGLAGAGFDPKRPAFFSWLGVTMYLETSAVLDTLRYIAGCARGSAVLFEYVTPLAKLPPMMRIAMEQVAAQLAQRGEPWKSYFDTDALTQTLAALGFSACRAWTPEELNERYLAGRGDGLHLGSGPGRLMLATV